MCNYWPRPRQSYTRGGHTRPFNCHFNNSQRQALTKRTELTGALGGYCSRDKRTFCPLKKTTEVQRMGKKKKCASYVILHHSHPTVANLTVFLFFVVFAFQLPRGRQQTHISFLHKVGPGLVFVLRKEVDRMLLWRCGVMGPIRCISCHLNALT